MKPKKAKWVLGQGQVLHILKLLLVLLYNLTQEKKMSHVNQKKKVGRHVLWNIIFWVSSFVDYYFNHKLHENKG